MNNHYCTLFDSNYLPQGRAMLDSLLYHDNQAIVFVLCIDDNVYENLFHYTQSARIILVHLSELEKHNSNLNNSKGNRTKVEYYWTCGPALLLYVFESFLDVNFLTYLDADLFFYSSPQIVFDQIGSNSIAVVPHNFVWPARRLKKYGIYNVSWVSFRRDFEGMRCLQNWHFDCIDYCGDRLDNIGRYGDQKYLDTWPITYKNVCVLQLAGVNLAIWNIGNYSLSYYNNGIIIDTIHPLIFYHFTGLKILDDTYFITNISRYFTPLTNLIRTYIYLPYIRKLIELGYLESQTKSPFLRKDNYSFNGIWKRLLRLVYMDKIYIK